MQVPSSGGRPTCRWKRLASSERNPKAIESNHTTGEVRHVNILMILNDPPYGTERVYNGLRLATNLLAKQEHAGEIDLDAFLMGDAASAAKSGQSTPNGYYSMERMLQSLIRKGGTVRVCGTCMDARGLTQEELLDGARRSTLDELTALTVVADKVLVF